MNNVNFSGRVASDPEMRYTQNGGAVANFTLMQNVGQRTTSLRCVMFVSEEQLNAPRRTNPDTGEDVQTRFDYFMSSVLQGHDVSVSGRLQNNNYSTETAGKRTQTFGMECIVLDWDHHTSPTEAARILANREQRQLNAQAEAEAVAAQTNKVANVCTDESCPDAERKGHGHLSRTIEQPAEQPELVTA